VTLVTLPYRTQLAAGQPEDIGMVLADFDAILAVVNGDIRNDNIAAAAAIQASKLQGYPSNAALFLNGNGAWTAPSGLGYMQEVAYAPATSDVGVTATTQATAQTVATAPAFTADGGIYWIEFYCGRVWGDPAGRQVVFRLFLDGTGVVDCASSGATVSATNVNSYDPVHIRIPQTPAAGSRVYTMRAYVIGGGGTSHVDCSSYTGFIRVTKERP